FPYIFGRELHDLAAERYPERWSLDNRETVRLLRDLPIGVFQLGRIVTGPYGCTAAPHPRQLVARRIVPGYLCSDATCSDVHSLELSTSTTATIVKTRSVV